MNKARLENELATVKLVQETLFPASESKIGNFHVMGHFEPASECGGDWWNYSKVGDQLFLWIGDATGHGAPAAMVTSAAKAAATIVEDLPFISPGMALKIMHKAIHETSKGKILMTFFIAAIDLKSGEMVYANASHEPPYLIRKKEGKVTKKDLEPLIEARGPRLGDQGAAVYNEVKVQLNPGDSILFYTDGIVDLQNAEGKSWGERGFIKTIVESAAAGPGLQVRMGSMTQKISQYRTDMALVDDITLFMCHYEDAA
jgi:phosphoserine phosphatase RsbU/P